MGWLTTDLVGARGGGEEEYIADIPMEFKSKSLESLFFRVDFCTHMA